MMRKMQHFYIITRSCELCPSVYYMSAGAIVLWRPLELLRPPFRGYARRLFLGGHKIEEMLFRTFVFASVLNDAQSLLSSLKPANSGRLYANADLFFASLDLDLFSFCSARSSQMKESVSMGQIDTAKGKTINVHTDNTNLLCTRQ